MGRAILFLLGLCLGCICSTPAWSHNNAVSLHGLNTKKPTISPHQFHASYSLSWLARRSLNDTPSAFCCAIANPWRKRIPASQSAFQVGNFVMPAALFYLLFRHERQRMRIPSHVARLYWARIRQQWMDRVIMGQEAVRRGLKVTPKEVFQSLLVDKHTPPAIAKQRLLQAKTKRLQLTKVYHLARYTLLATKLVTLYEQTTKVSNDQVKREFFKRRTKMQFSYFKIEPSKFTPPVVIQAPALKEFMRLYTTQMRGEYVKHRSKWCPPAKKTSRHIVLTFARRGAPTAAEFRQLGKKIKLLRQKALQKPAQFAALAKEYSQDPAAKRNGGLLPALRANALGWSPPYLRALFKLKRNLEISPVVRTQFGFHIIQLISTTQPHCQPFSRASVKRSIALKMLRRRARMRQLRKEMRRILRLWSKAKGAFKPREHKNASPLATWTNRALEPRMQTTQLFPEGEGQGMYIRGIGLVPGALVKRMFALTKIGQTAYWPTPIRGSFYLFRLTRKTQPTLEKFQKVKVPLHKQMLRRKRARYIHEQLKRLRQNVQVKTGKGMR